MDNGLGNIKIFPHHFDVLEETRECTQKNSLPTLEQKVDSSSSLRSAGGLKAKKHLTSAASMLRLFSLPVLSWGSSSCDSEKVELTRAEVESLRSDIADLEEREAHLKAQLENLDEILRSARLCGYLYIRTRWTALPGEPPIDDTDVDDWLPRFVVLHGSCLFFYLRSIDLSPQDSTLLSDVIEVGTLPMLTTRDEEVRYSFYILTRFGLRFECSTSSEVQADCWLTALQTDCNLASDTTKKGADKS